MRKFEKYRRTAIAEMTPVTESDIFDFELTGTLPVVGFEGNYQVSISQVDLDNGSPKLGDMIARNPENFADQWLVAEAYFKVNFEEL